MNNKPVLLIIDDLIQNIELMEAQLVSQDYEIRKATSGEAALAALCSTDVDLVLLDVMMPGMDGFEVTRRIRQNHELRRIPIILVTALRSIEDRVRGIDAGCDDFLSKPVDKTELIARVSSLLRVKAYNDLVKNYQTQLERDVAARTVELKKAFEQLKASSMDTIYRLSMAMEYKDEDTGAHIKRMSRYAAAVARKMGLHEPQLETILLAAPLHDLGKLGIPDAVLLKPGKLDAQEWEIMKKHSKIGADILKGSSAGYINLAETIARSHHEKWDGTGYPDGLKGTKIPIVVRCCSIADVFDALTSRRPYKEPFSVEEALKIISDGRGSHFDPAVVDAFFAIQPEILEIKREFADEPQLAV